MENEIKCPKCGTSFKIDEKYYDSIIKQVRDKAFEKQLNEREKAIFNEKESEIKLLRIELESENKENIAKKDEEIKELKNQLKIENSKKENEITNVKKDAELEYKEQINQLSLRIKDLEKIIEQNDDKTKIEINKLTSEKDKSISELKNKIELNEKEYVLKEKSIKEKHDFELKQKDEMIEYYKDLKARLSTKMIGETLEQHCNAEFSRIRPMFSSNTYFEKDNDAKKRFKGRFYF